MLTLKSRLKSDVRKWAFSSRTRDLILPTGDVNKGVVLADAIRHAVADDNWSLVDPGIGRITVSIGVGAGDGSHGAKQDTADRALYRLAQAVEHYEIARYGTLKAWAAQLGHKDAVKLINETLAEETKTDKLLTRLGRRANSAAVAKAAKAA